MKKKKSITIKTKLGVIEYTIEGRGTPVLLLHGGHSNCHDVLCSKGFDRKNFQLIIPSRPGYGKTPLGSHNTSKKTADLMVSLLDELELQSVMVYAVSASGLVGLEMSINYPNRVSGLVLASAISKRWLSKDDKVYKTARVIFNPTIEWFIWGMVSVFSYLTPNLIASNFYPQFSLLNNHKLNKSDVKELMQTLRKYRSKNGFIADIDHTINNESLKSITCPTVIIHSINDASVPIEHAEYAHKNISNSTILKLDNDWGHLFWLGNDASENLYLCHEKIKAYNKK